MWLTDQKVVVRHNHKLCRALSEAGSLPGTTSSRTAEAELGTACQAFRRVQALQAHLPLCLHPSSLAQPSPWPSHPANSSLALSLIVEQIPAGTAQE